MLQMLRVWHNIKLNSQFFLTIFLFDKIDQWMLIAGMSIQKFSKLKMLNLQFIIEMFYESQKGQRRSPSQQINCVWYQICKKIGNQIESQKINIFVSMNHQNKCSIVSRFSRSISPLLILCLFEYVKSSQKSQRSLLYE